MDVAPIVKVFDALLTAGAAVALAATAFFVMVAGFQYMSAGGSVRAVDAAKGSLYHALIGLAIVIMCKIIAGLVGGALGAPGATAAGTPLGPVAALVFLGSGNDSCIFDPQAVLTRAYVSAVRQCRFTADTGAAFPAYQGLCRDRYGQK